MKILKESGVARTTDMEGREKGAAVSGEASSKARNAAKVKTNGRVKSGSPAKTGSHAKLAGVGRKAGAGDMRKIKLLLVNSYNRFRLILKSSSLELT